MKPYEYKDYAGDRLAIRPNDEGIAVIETSFRDTVDGRPVMIPAHRLAEVVGALYQAAGQPVPDLPVIADEEQVNRLAKLIYQITYGHSTSSVTETSEWVARGLLAHGVTLPAVTP